MYFLFSILIIAIIQEAVELVRDITTKQYYSIFFMRRRAVNLRGSPLRAALFWALLEETRITTENHFNESNPVTVRPLRNQMSKFVGKFSNLNLFISKTYFSESFPVIDPGFQTLNVKPLMPLNTLWRRENDGIHSVGALFEFQTISCYNDHVELGKCWWPLCAAMISRNLNVSSFYNHIVRI